MARTVLPKDPSFLRPAFLGVKIRGIIVGMQFSILSTRKEYIAGSLGKLQSDIGPHPGKICL
jgi:hypothetical protein